MLQMALQEKKNTGATFIRFYLGSMEIVICLRKSNHLVVQLMYMILSRIWSNLRAH